MHPETGQMLCPSADDIVSFVLEELEAEKEIEVAAHLAACEECCLRVEGVKENLLLLDLWTARSHRAARDAVLEDCVIAAAAAAEARAPVEIETEGRRYQLGLYPEREGARWLLVVRPQFECPEGAEIIVRDHERVWLRAPVVNGRASGVLHGRPDLNRLAVSCHIQACAAADER
ncbi:MAG: hypothetical protein ACUVTQ_11025 [Desulfotomaculales bacterium]